MAYVQEQDRKERISWEQIQWMLFWIVNTVRAVTGNKTLPFERFSPFPKKPNLSKPTESPKEVDPERQKKIYAFFDKLAREQTSKKRK